jgi:hypothetical protein
MESYDRLTTPWMPYVMFFNQPMADHAHVSSDQYGFRRTILKSGAGSLSLEEFKGLDKPKAALILGGSAAFGVGATSDKNTIASRLNTCTDRQWFNFGGRAFNSTQEAFLFALFLPANIGKLVIFSGLNNFILPRIAASQSPLFPPFFFQSRFDKGMAVEADEILGVKYRARQLVTEIKHKIFRPAVKKTCVTADDQSLFTAFERDLKMLAGLGSAYHFDVHFFLQPFACWLDKPWTAEEKEIFAILDETGSIDWKGFAARREEEGRHFMAGLREVCGRCGVGFYNMNEDAAFMANEWLFVDRVHLTDRGYELAARIIGREAGLA